MACRRHQAPSHYLNQCWNIVNWTLGNNLQWNFNRNSDIFIDENTSENIVCEMLPISSRPQCVLIGMTFNGNKPEGVTFLPAYGCSLIWISTSEFILRQVTGDTKVVMLSLIRHISRVSCQKGPTRHAYAWQIGPFWQDTLDIWLPLTCAGQPCCLACVRLAQCPPISPWARALNVQNCFPRLNVILLLHDIVTHLKNKVAQIWLKVTARKNAIDPSKMIKIVLLVGNPQ